MNLYPTSRLGFHHCAGLPGLHASGTCQPKNLFCYKPGLKSEEACVQIVDSQEIDDPTRSFSTKADLNKDKKTFLRGPNRHCPSKDGSRRFFRDTRDKAYPSRTPHNHSKSWKSKYQRECCSPTPIPILPPMTWWFMNNTGAYKKSKELERDPVFADCQNTRKRFILVHESLGVEHAE